MILPGALMGKLHKHMKKTKTQKAMSKLGAIGGRATFKKYGRKHFSNLGKISAQKRKFGKGVDLSEDN